MKNRTKILFIAFAALIGGVACHAPKRCGCKGLPAMVFKTENIWLAGFGSRDTVNVLQGCDNTSIINVVEGRLPHFAISLDKSFLSLLDFSAVNSVHFSRNTGEYNFGTGIKYPLFNAITSHKVDRCNRPTGIEPIRQFANDFAGIYHLWCKPEGVWFNVLNNDNNGFSFGELQNSFIDRTGLLIKTMPNTIIH